MFKEILINFLTITCCFLLGIISIKYLSVYGLTIFIFLPFLLGAVPSFYVTKIKYKRNVYYQAVINLSISLFLLLFLAMEGIICIIMALPILLLLVLLGALIGKSVAKKFKVNEKLLTVFFLTSSMVFLSFDSKNKASALISVTTEIDINSSVENVWTNVLEFDSISPPKEIIFKTGISYPTDAKIKGRGIGAIRYCNFTTGSFVEPITEWNAPYELKFAVERQPLPMNEMNPFWNIQPLHLKGYFLSKKGEFKLRNIGDNQTQLSGTTWYELNIAPAGYWKLWSDFIIHKIHLRVLNHIKERSELDLCD
ncbi:hypothetical protein O2K51_12205 [Apibacter raozihei]|uniref:hypothetical protein n=1 Tax=Apibacter raozihei TaxID=2500547 RepID=UPI000FE3FC8B|nr:hypothetical protein [Apibacter raozihei]